MGVAGALGLFFSIIFHEFCHSLVARRFGIPMKGITLFIFGGVAEMGDEPPSARSEFFMAAAGPLSSILIGVVFYGLYLAGRGGGWPLPLNGVLAYLAWINILLALFNLCRPSPWTAAASCGRFCGASSRICNGPPASPPRSAPVSGLF